MIDLVPVICGAELRNGRTCKREVPAGFTRCYMHGGATPVAKAKAETQMALLRVPAVETLYEALEGLSTVIKQFEADTCATCGFPKGDLDEKNALIKACRGAVQAAAAILDRTGIGPRATLEVKQSDSDFDLSLLTPEERKQITSVLAEYRDLKQTIQQRIHGSAFKMPAHQVN